MRVFLCAGAGAGVHCSSMLHVMQNIPMYDPFSFIWYGLSTFTWVRPTFYLSSPYIVVIYGGLLNLFVYFFFLFASVRYSISEQST